MFEIDKIWFEIVLYIDFNFENDMSLADYYVVISFYSLLYAMSEIENFDLTWLDITLYNCYICFLLEAIHVALMQINVFVVKNSLYH